MKRINNLELALLIIFIASGCGAVFFGQTTEKSVIFEGFDRRVEAGYQGGALALGIISATALMGMIWIETIRLKRINGVELTLLILFIASSCGAIFFGQNVHPTPIIGGSLYRVETGYHGGAIALGIISATTLIGIIWIEIIRLKRKG